MPIVYLSKIRATEKFTEQATSLKHMNPSVIVNRIGHIVWGCDVRVNKTSFKSDVDYTLTDDEVKTINPSTMECDDKNHSGEDYSLISDNYVYQGLWFKTSHLYELCLVRFDDEQLKILYREVVNFDPFELTTGKPNNSGTTGTRNKITDEEKICNLIKEGKTAAQAIEQLAQAKIKSATVNYKNDPTKLSEVLKKIEQAKGLNFGYQLDNPEPEQEPTETTEQDNT